MPLVLHQTTGEVDGDAYITMPHPDWTPDTKAELLGPLVKDEHDLDNLDAPDVDATISAIRARPIMS